MNKKTAAALAAGLVLCTAAAAGSSAASDDGSPDPAVVLLPGGVSRMLAQERETESVPEEESETEFDWSVYASDVQESSGFTLDESYIEAYGEEVCSNMIFYGDSRVVGMSYTIGGNYYVGMEGAGYDWMRGEGLTDLEKMMADHPDADVVFCFGVNDPGNSGAYIDFFGSMQDKYPERRFWYLSVNPVYDGISSANGYNARNGQIEDFNAQIQAAFPDRYIDSWSYLKEYGYNAQDGVHYDGDTYFAIQNFCWRAITQKLDMEKEKETE